MKSLTAKLLYLLIDIIHSMVWAFKNNYLFEAWRKIEWGGVSSTSCKSIICSPFGAAEQFEKDLKEFKKSEKRQKETLADILIKSAKEKTEYIQPKSGNQIRMKKRDLEAFQRIGRDIAKYGLVKVCEFGQRL